MKLKRHEPVPPACSGRPWQAAGHPRASQPDRNTAAFTMIEVALSLAIVAFAMVAIIGVMPAGLNVQRENREDTIISQDAALILEAIRSGYGSSNVTSLSTSLLGITGPAVPPAGTNYTPLDLVKRLCIPRWDTTNATNVVRAHLRAMSGNLADAAAGSSAVAFSYVVTSEVNNYVGDPSNNGPLLPYSPSPNAYLSNNLYEVKLTFQWPVYEAAPGVFPSRFGNGRMVVRTMISGQLTNDTGGYVFNGSTYRGQ
jgi:hypothetical protein